MRALALLLVLVASLARAAAHAVRASEKEFLADQVMVFDNDPHETAADDHVLLEPRRRRRRPRRRRRRMRLQLSSQSLRCSRSLLELGAPRSPTIAPRSRPRCSPRSATAARAGSLVVHPQADFGIDLGRYVSLDVGYSADAVTGATATVYQVDAVSSATKFSDLRHEGTFALGFKGRRSRSRSSARSAPSATTSRARSAAPPRSTCPAATRPSRSPTATASTRSATRTTAMATPLERRALDRRRRVRRRPADLRQRHRRATTIVEGPRRSTPRRSRSRRTCRRR